jgi:hypothetical protein
MENGNRSGGFDWGKHCRILWTIQLQGKVQFLYYARGSLFEAKFWLNRSLARKLSEDGVHKEYSDRLTHAARQINTFAGSLKSQKSMEGSKIIGSGIIRCLHLRGSGKSLAHFQRS